MRGKRDESREESKEESREESRDEFKPVLFQLHSYKFFKKLIEDVYNINSKDFYAMISSYYDLIKPIHNPNFKYMDVMNILDDKHFLIAKKDYDKFCILYKYENDIYDVDIYTKNITKVVNNNLSAFKTESDHYYSVMVNTKYNNILLKENKINELEKYFNSVKKDQELKKVNVLKEIIEKYLLINEEDVKKYINTEFKPSSSYRSKMALKTPFPTKVTRVG